MKLKALLIGSLFFVSLSAIAGEGHKKCNADAQTCLNKMTSYYAGVAWDGINVEGIGSHDPVRVTEVDADSPGDTAGIQKGDVLVAMNGKAMTHWSNQELKAAMKAVTPGDVITYTIQRGDETFESKVTVAHIPKKTVATWVGYHLVSQHAELGEKVAQN